VWGDPDVYNLTPMHTGHIKRSFSTDPQKPFSRSKIKYFEKKLCKRTK